MGVWRRIGATAWAGLSCTECRGQLGKPWYYRRVAARHLRRCADCHRRTSEETIRRLEAQQTLFREPSTSVVRKLEPPYAARHPMPPEYTPTQETTPPWE